MISLWLLQFEIWIIIGIIFILLELTDGSTIFFLPLGIGSLILSFYIYLSNIGIINQNIIIDTWYIALVIWAILSLISSLFMVLIRKRYSNENPDINDYFGRSVSLDNKTLLVTSRDDSNQTTITNGTTASTDNSNTDSGAAYVFVLQ